MRFIGDVHGKWLTYRNQIHNPRYGCTQSIQVGDFGMGYRQSLGFIKDTIKDMRRDGHSHRFIRGNHDSPQECSKNPQWIKDGTIEGDMMFVGGAHSIDRDFQTFQGTWWEDEELSYDQCGDMMDVYNKHLPKIMVTHDGPDQVMRYFFKFYQNPNESITRQLFESMFSHHQPKLWVFGHWHEPRDEVIMGTRFVCLPELAYIDIDLNDPQNTGKIVLYQHQV